MAVRVVKDIISSVRLVVREAFNGVAMEVDESVLNTLCKYTTRVTGVSWV
jgi:hypothetical protein